MDKQKNSQKLINQWKNKRKQVEDNFFTFLTKLKNKDNQTVDEIAEKIHQETFAKIDCLQCANCCKTISPVFKSDDITRIAQHLQLKKQDFIAQYLQIDEDGDHVLKSAPCAFLADDNTCKIYEVRPQDCADYPHTTKKNFSSRRYLHIQNVYACPAVFHIIATMEKQIK